MHAGQQFTAAVEVQGYMRQLLFCVRPVVAAGSYEVMESESSGLTKAVRTLKNTLSAWLSGYVDIKLPPLISTPSMPRAGRSCAAVAASKKQSRVPRLCSASASLEKINIMFLTFACCEQNHAPTTSCDGNAPRTPSHLSGKGKVGS